MFDSLTINRSHLGCLLFLLFSSTSLENTIKLLLTLGKLLFYLSMSADSIFYPRMRSNPFNFKSFTRLKSNHMNKEILETFREEVGWSFSRMSFPENIVFLFLYDLIVRIIQCCLLERRISSVHNEQNHTSSKDITTFSLILFSWNLRCHITLSSKFSFQDTCSILPLEQAREPKISNFEYI